MPLEDATIQTFIHGSEQEIAECAAQLGDAELLHLLSIVIAVYDWPTLAHYVLRDVSTHRGISNAYDAYIERVVQLADEQENGPWIGRTHVVNVGRPAKEVWPMPQSNPTTTYLVTQDGKELFRGTSEECFGWLLHHQSASVDWACRYEGYAIEPLVQAPVSQGEPPCGRQEEEAR